MQVATGEDAAGWLAFLRDLTARGLTGVKRVTSDAHRGLVDAIAFDGTGEVRVSRHIKEPLRMGRPASSATSGRRTVSTCSSH